MNILIKLTCLIGLVIAPILGGHSLDTDQVSADIEVKKEVILKNDNNVWTMSVTSKENDNGEITNTTETISGSEEEVMSALREYNLNEVEKLAASAMAKIDK